MFENILHQPVTERLVADITAGSLAPAILFSGPEYGGKGAAALELARVLGCEGENPGGWNCSCPSCVRHRGLASPDLLLLGRRCFFQEIAASSRAFLRGLEGEPGKFGGGARILFIRSVRKLLARFDPVLWEDDPKLGKIGVHISALEEDLGDFEGMPPQGSGENVKKLLDGILKKAAKLEAEGLGELIPIAWIRRASYWTRLAPLGRRKCVIIENADQTQEGAKNSLLKILEEPPPRVTLVLTSSRPRSLPPTLLSRLREYRFVKRSLQGEREVISRIFREPLEAEKAVPAGESGAIETYLNSFLPASGETLYPLGAFFAASVAAEAARGLRRKRRDIPPVLADLGKFAVPIAGEAGMSRPAEDFKGALETILKGADNFEVPGLWRQFLRNIESFLSAWLRNGQGGPEKSVWAGLWLRELNRAAAETGSYNIAPPMALERLLEALKTGIGA
ncbi:MAG: DNA polymerase III [Treponema sp.]|jgi:DNA polymerase-3 subunit gamma/tau|nr:DNA polymerase III [Treponema sp.]